jgi:NAD(P)-dependent dehydrogenase (short-subunit alcohol dehydrogenase family)
MENTKWTTALIPDLTGKVIIVTGGNSGLGFESVKAFAAKNADIILTSRSLQKGEEAKALIRKEVSGGKITVMELDLMELASVRKFVSKFKEKYNRLDILLNNAGIMTTPYGLTKDGFEGQMGTNHLGHFALTGQLLDMLKSTAGSRVVNVSSNAHKYGKMDFDNLLFKEGKDYTPISAYGRSKLANLLFTYELQRRFEDEKIDCIAVAAHPGVALTNLARHLEGKLLFKLLVPVFNLMAQTPAMGALPQIRAAVDPDLKGSEYFGPGGFREFKGYPVLVPSNEDSHNKEDARRLWEVSEKLTGVVFFPAKVMN